MEISKLNGPWTITNKERKIEMQGTAPITVFEALLENKLIEDPFYGENEHTVSWVYESDWEYTLMFEVAPKFLSKHHQILRFKGLDTFTEITLNNAILGTTNNMFRKFEFEVKESLKDRNVLKIKFFSNPQKAVASMKQLRMKKLPIATYLPGVNFIRKPQYSFGWDWGPNLPDVGIWQHIELCSWDGPKIDTCYVTQKFEYSFDPYTQKAVADLPRLKVLKTHLTIDINYQSAEIKPEDQLSIEIKDPMDKIIFNRQEPLHPKSLIQNHLQIPFTVENPQLWWTNGLGESALYTVKAEIIHENDRNSLEFKIGLRDLRLIRERDRWGESFFFMINGVPLFAKGADWIPIDNFIPRGKKLGLYESNLLAAKDANMNFLRVWGGGIYEDDDFYSFCDRIGILIWQDFMFACNIYPPTPEFLENIKTEAIDNIQRIRNHPSIALWCGNNEIEQQLLMHLANAIRGGKFWFYKRGYDQIFEEMLPKLVAELDPNRSYWPSSPSNGGGKRKRGFLASNNPNFGDSHYWMVWHGGRPFTAYRKFDSRFMSEYGFESFPSMKTLAAICPPDQFDFFSPIMKNHQKNSAGNGKIMKYMENRFSIPKFFENQVILSQITQGEAMEYGIEHWRRNRNNFHCMGSLYWQLNDCWPVASWASIDYYGRWKALHYMTRRAYNPVVVNVKEEKDSVEIWAVNDLQLPQPIQVEWTIQSTSGKEKLANKINQELGPCQAALLHSIPSLIEAGINPQEDVLFFDLHRDHGVTSSDMNPLLGFRFLCNPKELNLQNPHLDFSVKQHTGKKNTFDVTISAKLPAFYVHLDFLKLDFLASDNYFGMIGTKPQGITIEILTLPYYRATQEDIIYTAQEIEDQLIIRSLYDLVHDTK